MAKKWVLRTETKGTGAHMAPLEDVLEKPGSRKGITSYARKRRKRQATETPEPKAPRFKIVDVLTQQVLAEGASTTEAVDLLKGVRSIVDVRMYIWDDRAGKWRLISSALEKDLWRASRPAD